MTTYSYGRGVERVFCKHKLHDYSFLIETDDGEVAMCLCRDCYDRLKGGVLQDAINEALRQALPGRLRIPQRRP